MNDSESPVPQMEWQKFLETCPPGQRRELTEFVDYQHPSVCEFKAPVLGLFCDSEVCNKICFFDGSSGTSQLSYESLKPVYFTYRCRHCKHSLKFFSVMFETTEGNDLKVYGEKMGE